MVVQVQSNFNNFSEITCEFIEVSVRAQLSSEEGSLKRQLIENRHEDWQPDFNTYQNPCFCSGCHPQAFCIKYIMKCKIQINLLQSSYRIEQEDG